MGSKIIIDGEVNGVKYQIFDIDNTYTVYIKIENQSTPQVNDKLESVYSAIASFNSLKEAQDYASKLKPLN